MVYLFIVFTVLNGGNVSAQSVLKPSVEECMETREELLEVWGKDEVMKKLNISVTCITGVPSNF